MALRNCALTILVLFVTSVAGSADRSQAFSGNVYTARNPDALYVIKLGLPQGNHTVATYELITLGDAVGAPLKRYFYHATVDWRRESGLLQVKQRGQTCLSLRLRVRKFLAIDITSPKDNRRHVFGRSTQRDIEEAIRALKDLARMVPGRQGGAPPYLPSLMPRCG